MRGGGEREEAVGQVRNGGFAAARDLVGPALLTDTPCVEVNALRRDETLYDSILTTDLVSFTGTAPKTEAAVCMRIGRTGGELRHCLGNMSCSRQQEHHLHSTVPCRRCCRHEFGLVISQSRATRPVWW